ncbi:MAG: YheU family protein [Pseudomonadota bacterium]
MVTLSDPVRTPGVRIPHDELSPAALTGVIDAFVLREGTDYGHRDYTLAEKRSRVRTMLDNGEAFIEYSAELEHIEILLRD